MKKSFSIWSKNRWLNFFWHHSFKKRRSIDIFQYFEKINLRILINNILVDVKLSPKFKTKAINFRFFVRFARLKSIMGNCYIIHRYLFFSFKFFIFIRKWWTSTIWKYFGKRTESWKFKEWRLLMLFNI